MGLRWRPVVFIRAPKYASEIPARADSLLISVLCAAEQLSQDSIAAPRHLAVCVTQSPMTGSRYTGGFREVPYDTQSTP